MMPSQIASAISHRYTGAFVRLWHADDWGLEPSPDHYVTVATFDPVHYARAWGQILTVIVSTHVEITGAPPRAIWTHIPRTCEVCASVSPPGDWIACWAVSMSPIKPDQGQDMRDGEW